MHYDERCGERAGGWAVPRLRLPSRRLECCGFTVGDALQVTLGNGLLPISRGKGKNWAGGDTAFNGQHTPPASFATTQSTNTRKRRSPHARASSYR